MTALRHPLEALDGRSIWPHLLTEPAATDLLHAFRAEVVASQRYMRNHMYLDR